MIGKLIGKTVGTVVAAPLIVAAEAEEALDEVAKTLTAAVDRATEPKKR